MSQFRCEQRLVVGSVCPNRLDGDPAFCESLAQELDGDYALIGEKYGACPKTIVAGMQDRQIAGAIIRVATGGVQ